MSCVDLSLVDLAKLALDMVTHCAKLTLAGPHGPLDRAVHLGLFNWDVDRCGWGSP